MVDRLFRVCAVLLAAVLLLAGCRFPISDSDVSHILHASDPNTQGSDTVPEPERSFALAYYTGEVLDPYTSSSRTNAELLRLCYCGLFTLDASFNAVPVLAESWSVDGDTVLIRLRQDVRFSDGSKVTAADCVASYRRAAASGSVWRYRFSYVRAYDAVDEITFRVRFYEYYPSQLNLLTVPIVRADAADALGYPVGCGRYAFARRNGGAALVKADCGCVPGKYDIKTITMLGIADEEALVYNFNYGRIQAACADPAAGAEAYRSNNEIVAVPSNRLTVLVVNKTRAPFSSLSFSRGLTYLIDRAELTETALNTFGTGVWQPLNPAWSRTVQAELNPSIRSTAQASEAFTAAGCRLSGDTRYYYGEAVHLRLLVNRESAVRMRAAESIAQQLRGAGFGVTVTALTWEEYKTAIAEKKFDLYLGEVNLPQNMNVSALFRSSVCDTGEGEGTYEALESSVQRLLAGRMEVREFTDQFQSRLPFIPLYYASDALAVSMDVPGTFGTSPAELYAGIENWSLSSGS